jgi:hypothetical protein
MSGDPDGVDRGRSFDFGRKRFVSAGLVVAALAIGGTAAAVVGRGGLETFRTAPPPDAQYLLFGLAFAVVDLSLGGLRLWVLAHRIAPSVTWLDCIRVNLGNMCMAGLTPGQTGGGAAQLYLFRRAGLGWRGGVAVGTINFLVSIAVLVVWGIVALTLLRTTLPHWLRTSTLTTVIILLVMILLGLLLIGKGQFLGRLDKADPKAGRIRRWISNSRAFVHESLEVARELLREHPLHSIAVLPLTLAVYASKFAYTWAVFRAFQPVGHFDDMIGALIVLILSLYFAPTPGASGIAEGATTAFLSGALPTASAVGFVLYWRALTLYVPIVLGGLVLLAQLRRDAQDVRAMAEAKSTT